MMRLRSQLTTFQLPPPSSLRHTEPWSFVWINAYMRCGLEGAMVTSILPSGGFGSPFAIVRCVQVWPLSCEMYTPLPGPPQLGPGAHAELPGAGEHGVGVSWIHAESAAAGFPVHEQRLLPALAAVGGAEHAAL